MQEPTEFGQFLACNMKKVSLSYTDPKSIALYIVWDMSQKSQYHFQTTSLFSPIIVPSISFSFW